MFKNKVYNIILYSLVTVVLALFLALTSPSKTVALLVGLILFFIAFYRPLSIIFLLAAYTPFEPFLLKFVSDDIYVYARYLGEFLIYVMVALIIFKFLIGRQKLIKTPLDLPFILFVLVAITSIFVNLVPATTAVLGIRMLVRFILIFYIVVYLRPPKKFIKSLVYLMIAIVFLQAILGAAQTFIGYPLDNLFLPRQEKFIGEISLTSGTEQNWIYGQRVFATMGRYDQLGTFLAFFMLIMVGFLYEKYFKNKEFVWFWFLISGFTLLMTYSRSSWFGLLLGLFIIGYIIKKDKKIIKFYGLAVAVILIYLLFSPLIINQLIDQPQVSLTERFFEAFSLERWRGEYYGLGRLFFIIKTPLVVVSSSPFVGVGPGMYGGGTVRALNNTTVYDRLALPFGIWGTEGHIDNNWMSIWGETGTLGLLCYFGLIFSLCKLGLAGVKKSKNAFTRGLSLGYCGAIAAVCLNAFLATSFEIRTLAFYFWLIGGLIFTLLIQEKENDNFKHQ